MPRAVSGSISGSVSGLPVNVQRVQRARSRSGQGGSWKHPERPPCLGIHGRNNSLVTEPPIVHFFSLLCRLGGVVLDMLLKQAMPSLWPVTCESGRASYRRPHSDKARASAQPHKQPAAGGSHGSPAAGQTVKRRALVGPWKHESIVIDAPHLVASTSRVSLISRRLRHHTYPIRNSILQWSVSHCPSLGAKC